MSEIGSRSGKIATRTHAYSEVGGKYVIVRMGDGTWSVYKVKDGQSPIKDSDLLNMAALDDVGLTNTRTLSEARKAAQKHWCEGGGKKIVSGIVKSIEGSGA